METWFIIIILWISIAALLKPILNFLSPTPKLPPGPLSFPILGNLQLLRSSFAELEPVLRALFAKLGPIITLHIGPRPAIFIADRSLAHQALVHDGAVFASSPSALDVSKIIRRKQHNIINAPYGPTWRLLRRNLTSEILHPSRVKSYSRARNWVLQILLDRLKSQSENEGPVRAVENFQYAMFCLSVLMCFGDKLDENKIKKIEGVQRRLLLSFPRFNLLNFCPKLIKILLGKRWQELFKLVEDQENVLIPLIRARKKAKQSRNKENHDGDEYVLAYVDTLFALQLPEEKNRKLDEQEIVSLCSEFITAGTDATSTALQWIMANLVKCPKIQEKLFMEIKGVVGNEERIVKEDDLQKMPYLKAVILEGLRRHPPGHFVLPHAVTQDTVLGGFLVPKNGIVNFSVAEIGRDPKVWEEPMAFKPERFMNSDEKKMEAFDITGSKEIKMMPFGVGRRICPGLGLALLHLEYFMANLVWNFEWKAVDGDDVDLEEKPEFTIVMKNPLKAMLVPRFK